VFVADGPADGYEHIWIWVTEVSLIPAEGRGRSPVVIFRSQSGKGYKIDLLDCQEEDFLLTVKRRVPAGRYEKVRLKIADINSEGGPCDKEWIKLPSGKIDLNPRGTFEVKSGGTLSIRLDIDANKSINLHPAGQSGKCIFRPVVFVDIEPVKWRLRCPSILKGEIDRLIDEDSDGAIEGFMLALAGGRGTLEVHLLEDVVIFDDDGLPATSSDLAIEQTVWVRGRLNAKGCFQASLVVIGDVLLVKGTVEGPVDSEGVFPLQPDPGQEFVDGTIDVKVEEETLVLIGCDERVGPEAIQKGMRALVVGKYSIQGQVLLAVAVLLRPEVISGELLSLEEAAGGSNLIIQIGEDQNVSVFLPAGNPIYLEGDGEVPLDLLSDLLECNSRLVRVVLDPEQSELTAREVHIQADRLEGQVDAVDELDRSLIIDGQTVLVQPGATIIDLRAEVDCLVGFDKINLGDELVCFGLEACPEDSIDFYSFVILIIGPAP